METEKLLMYLYQNFHHVLVFILLIIVLKKIVNQIEEGKHKGKESSLEFMNQEEKKLHVYTQLNTKLNQENLDNAISLSDKYHYEIYGKKNGKSGVQSSSKKSKTVKRVKFAEHNIYHD